jgi:dipeptidyl aminopeptidase/acylaminoacyl peptidase
MRKHPPAVRLAALAALLAAAFAPPAAHPADKLVPIEAFTERDQYSLPRLSPDGKHIAVSVRMPRAARGDLPTMTIYSLPDRLVVNTIMLPSFEVPLDIVWLTNERLMVMKGLEVGTRERPQRTGEVVALNIDGKKQEYLYGYKGFKQNSKGDRYGDDYGWAVLSDVPRSRNGHVFLSTHLWQGDSSQLYDINTSNSTRKLLAEMRFKEMSFLQQSDGNPVFAYGTDEQYLPILYRRDPVTGYWRKIDGIGRHYQPFTFAHDDKSFYLSYSASGGPSALMTEDLETGKRTTVARDDFGSVNHLEYSAFPEVPFGARTDIGIPKLQYIDENSADAKLHRLLSAQFPGSYVHFINFSDDGGTLLFSARSDRDPGSYYLFDRKSGKADLLFTNLEKIDPDLMGERRPIQFTARDGLKLAGYLTLPHGHAGKKLPMVLLPHGGPFGPSDDWFFDTDAQFLASRGYAVLQVNFRGSGGRGRNFENSGFRQWGGKLLEDLADGVKWANTQPEIDAARVCVYGGSYGGYAALMLPVREPAMFKCAIGYAGQYDLASIYKADEMSGEKALENFYIRTLGNDPATLRANSPVYLADQIKVPVLMVHGGHDKRTEIAQAEAMRDALIKAGRPPEWYKVDIEGHGFYDPEYRTIFYSKLEAFLDKHIGH